MFIVTPEAQRIALAVVLPRIDHEANTGSLSSAGSGGNLSESLGTSPSGHVILKG